MANNVFKIKRTSVSGRAANTSTLTNPGELALNMTDGIMYSTNGSSIFEVGANLTSARITSSLTIDNDKSLRFKTVNTSAYAYFTQQSDDNFVFYTTTGAYVPRPIFSIYANSGTSSFNIGVPVSFTGTNVSLGTAGVSANGGLGSAGQYLTSNGTATYWSSPGVSSINTAAQYTWTNNHTFQANVSVTGSGIAVNSNTGSVYFGGISDANWRISRNAGVTTKFFYTNNSLDIIAASSPKEGIVFGWTGNSYLEVGYAGTYTTLPVYVGNSSVNLAINSTSIVGNSVAIGSSTTAVFYNYNSQVNASAGDFKSNAYATLGGGGGNYLAFGQQTNFAQWIQSGYSAASPAYYNIILNPLGGNVGIGNTTPTHRLSINGNTYISDTLTVGTATVNTTNFTGTANNTSFVGSVSAANVVSNAQLSGNLANYVTTTNLTNNLANYQTTAGLSANVATLAANSATYLGNSSGTIANIASWITSNASAAYTNAVSYTDGKISTANSAITGNAATAYTNAVSYTDSKIATANSAITGNAATAYSNAVSYTDSKILTANSAITGNAATAYTNATIFASNASNINTGTLAEARLPYRMNQNLNSANDVTFGSLTLTGNLNVSGNVTVIGANNLSITDNFIYLNANNTTQNIDVGIAANYNSAGYAHTGIFRDASDGTWKVFDNYAPEPDANVNIDTTNTSFHLANFQANVVYVGNTSVYSTVNTTNFTGTSNNTLFVGSVSAANVVSNAQLSANLGNYQTTAGLSANVATLTANNTSFVGSVTAANVVSNAQLQANLGNYQTTAGLNANIASYLPTYTGVVNASTISIGSSVTANSTKIVIGTSVSVEANGSVGSANQVLTSNGTTVYWANASGGAAANSTGGTGAIQYYNGTTLGSSANLIFNGTSVSVGNTTVNTVVNSTATIAMFTMMNRQTISDDYTIPTSTGASMIGPITVATGKTLTVASGARLVIL